MGAQMGMVTKPLARVEICIARDAWKKDFGGRGVAHIEVYYQSGQMSRFLPPKEENAFSRMVKALGKKRTEFVLLKLLTDGVEAEGRAFLAREQQRTFAEVPEKQRERLRALHLQPMPEAKERITRENLEEKIHSSKAVDFVSGFRLAFGVVRNLGVAVFLGGAGGVLAGLAGGKWAALGATVLGLSATWLGGLALDEFVWWRKVNFFMNHDESVSLVLGRVKEIVGDFARDFKFEREKAAG